MKFQKLIISSVFFLLCSVIGSCNKEKLETGLYTFSVSSSHYIYDENVFFTGDIPSKNIALINSSKSLLEFEYHGTKNYLSVDSTDQAQGIWVFDELVEGTTSKLGFNLVGLLEKQKRQWTISGTITFKKKHYNGAFFTMVDVIGNFRIEPE